MNEVEPFKDAALEEIAHIIAEFHTSSQITMFFARAGYPHIVHDTSTKWRFVYESLLSINKTEYGSHEILKVIKTLCDPQAFFSNPETHEKIILRINKVLTFYALEISTEGALLKKVAKGTRLEKTPESIKLFDARSFHHKVILHGRKLFLESNYSNAVFECCKAYDKEVRVFSQIDDHGASLMNKAFSEKGPIKLNAQQTLSEKNEQEGIMHLSRGLMFAIRNPQGHEPSRDWPISQEEALDLLSFLSYLFKKLENSVALVDNKIHKPMWSYVK